MTGRVIPGNLSPMGRLHLGPVAQLGYVVDDIAAAMRHWTTVLGVGPFSYLDEAPLRDVTYRDAPTAARIGVALSYSGDMQIELIQQLDDAPSVYTDFLRAHGPGLHHLGYAADDFDLSVAALADAGYVPIQHGNSGPATRFAYFPTDTHGGTMVELLEMTMMTPFFEHIRRTTLDWDGADPIRPMGG